MGATGDIAKTIHYSTFFILGSYFALNKKGICDFIKKLPQKSRISLWIFALLFYAYPFDNPWSLSARSIGDLGISIGAILIMALAMTSNKFNGELKKI